MPIFACKLPHGLSITTNGRTIVLLGANIGENLENVSRNGEPTEHRTRISGYGLTTLSDNDTEALTAWKNEVTFKNGNPADGKLPEPFPAFENGAILGPFKSVGDAQKEVDAMQGLVTTGFEGLDPTKEGTDKVKIEADKDAGKK